MTRRLLLLLSLLVATLVFGAAGRVDAAPPPGSFTKHTHPGVGATGPRDYWVYLPSVAPVSPPPLVVYLHGCNQTAVDAATGTKWNALAEQRGFVVAYPEQPVTANGISCWNWFLPEHQGRGAGEPAVIAGITQDVISATGADPRRVYVLGASAGADMSMIMGATYPDVFAAVGGLAGCAYVTCTDVTGTQTRAAMGPLARVMPAFLVQGTADVLNNFALGETMVRQWAGADDLIDDGADNNSIPQTGSRLEHHGFDASLVSGAGTVGDTCVRNRQFPCAGALVGAKEYPYSIEHYDDANKCAVVDFWIIHGLAHGYPGGDPAGTFTDPIGPDITTAAYDFFLRHRLDAAPCAGVAAAAGSPAAGSAGEPQGGAASETVAAARSAGSSRDSHPATGGTAPVVLGLFLVGTVLVARRSAAAAGGGDVGDARVDDLDVYVRPSGRRGGLVDL